MTDARDHRTKVPSVAINLPHRPLIHKEGEVCARLVLGTAAPHIEISGTTYADKDRGAGYGTRLYAVINLTWDDIQAIILGCDDFRTNCIKYGLEIANDEDC